MSGIDEATDPAALIGAYYDAGWTGGLPRGRPGGGLEGREELGVIAGRNAVVLAEKAAINAVMAGCRPEYMPVVVAAVRSLCDPAFAYPGPARSTRGAAGGAGAS